MSLSKLQMIAYQAGVPIVELSAKKIAEIMVSPQAQLRTAKYKRAVYLVEDLVFKGPYRSYDQGLIKNLRFNYAIELLETALQLSEWQKSSLPWVLLGYAGFDQYYLATANVGKQDNIPFEVMDSRLEMNVKIVRRGRAVKRVSEIEGSEGLTEHIKLASLQHLYLRFLLDIGDSGTHNVLVREDYPASGRLIAGIDLEETRGIKKKQRRFDLLFKKPPSKEQVRLYESDVCNIKSLRQIDLCTSDQLRAIGVDLVRLIENMKVWENLN